ncbi:CPA2 family monovalent cation:H+ antiporter-2/glutathione-regulated potassium-efflux system protein KefB [Paracoccus versutus]|uniref:CPA2 family monovalent cation:H+ antiporter-2/glutathione-regulated potassium-efflux system protein KefB n=1 Tax=Paracoccus versutus TaxID=34007 RepID=A0AAQ0KMR3_PARVE|nr:monovalent cation:proton antiporter-2 (CPA2) family protein [Paracoccus versutus]REG48343.1 CPA2 family monovalent cation:H+ antiporter-2/glutathione-regulated potassium-efflux system protein KefB [Paracoccus versutus]
MTAAAEAAGHGGGGMPLVGVVVLLAAAVLAVPLFRKLGLGSVLGYLAAGLAIGPFGLGFFDDPQAIIHVAELGVVLFLFVIGLEMQPSRLWAMRGEIFVLGFAQVLLAIAALTCVGLALGFPVAASFVSGTGFVLTSTAIVMQMLAERGEIALPKGRRIIAILLFEDLAIVPLLALVAFLAPGGEDVTLSQRLAGIAIGLGCIAALVAAGRYLLNPMFGLLARFGGREVMTAAALLVVLGAGLLMQWGGLSMAMGAFLAGVLLSESSFRHQLEADVEPFRGLLLGLFFLGVGMALDLTVIAANWALIAICVPAYMLLKMLVIYAVGRVLRASRAEALERAVLMAQGGEFAFVLYSSAMQFGIISGQDNAILTAIVIVSMVLTPLLIILHDRLAPKPAPSLDGVEAAQGLQARVLMIGFGRMGQIVSQPLIARGHSISIVESDPQTIRDADEFGFKVWYGDGARLDILHAAGAGNASLIVAVPGDRQATTRIVELAKHEFPLVPVIARAFDREHARELVEAGADYQLRETLESAFALGREALLQLGDDPDEIDEVMAEIRGRDMERFEMECVGGIFAGRDLLLGNRRD